VNADNWYVRDATGESIGPLSEVQVREMLLRTTDLQGTKVRQGNSAWLDASYVLKRFNECTNFVPPAWMAQMANACVSDS
jgi:hypothetical protein